MTDRILEILTFQELIRRCVTMDVDFEPINGQDSVDDMFVPMLSRNMQDNDFWRDRRLMGIGAERTSLVLESLWEKLSPFHRFHNNPRTVSAGFISIKAWQTIMGCDNIKGKIQNKISIIRAYKNTGVPTVRKISITCLF